MAYDDFPQSLDGKYNQDKHNQGDPKLDVLLDIRQSTTDLFNLRFLDALQIQISNSINAPGEQTALLITNNTTVGVSIDQIVNAEAISTQASQGASVVSMLFYFNPDLTGATEVASDTKAYANGFDGKFVDVTGSGILFSVLNGFDTGINTDVVRVVGGQVAYFQSAQGLPSSSLNGQVNLSSPFTLAPGDSMVASFTNTALVDDGTSALTTALISGKFLSIYERVEVAPPNLLAENGDNLIAEDGSNLVGE